jgi:hypothetical protein
VTLLLAPMQRRWSSDSSRAQLPARGARDDGVGPGTAAGIVFGFIFALFAGVFSPRSAASSAR